ncbi:MAG: bifunctional diguanylate cyclase/phosphodiesterase [Parvibaculum sp.]
MTQDAAHTDRSEEPLMTVGFHDLTRHVIGAVGDVAYHWNIKTDQMSWGQGAASLLGVSDETKLPTQHALMSRIAAFHGMTHQEAFFSTANSDKTGVAYQLEYQVKDDFGGMRWVEDRGRWYGDAEGRPAFAIGVLRSIDARFHREQQLVRLSTYDELTGLLNRIRLKESLGEILVSATLNKMQSAFLLLAIDNLAHINDAFGFDVADEVIIGVGNRLREVARRGDGLGRYAGNKFGLVLRNCSEEQLPAVSRRLLDFIRGEVITTTRGPVAATISAGAIALPQHAVTVEQALSRAEESLLHAKAMRRDSFVIYAPCREREKTRVRNINVADELIAALNERRIRLAYQPVVSAVNGETSMYECLIRMEQPDGTILPAFSFVPLAEKLGLISLLDYRAMELAVETLKAYPGVHLSLNVSGRTTSDRMWRDALMAYLQTDRDLAERLVIEITETVAMEEIAELAEFFASFRAMGCKIAIDDFGAGYTSFRNLKTMDVDLVKIDGSYVEGLVTNPDNQLFVRTFVELARNFNLPTIAEWVDSPEEVAMLRELGVDYFQGFYLGKPELSLPLNAGQGQNRSLSIRA